MTQPASNHGVWTPGDCKPLEWLLGQPISFNRVRPLAPASKLPEAASYCQDMKDCKSREKGVNMGRRRADKFVPRLSLPR